MSYSRRSQRGVILLMLLIALTLIIIAMGIAAPKLAEAIKRDVLVRFDVELEMEPVCL